MEFVNWIDKSISEIQDTLAYSKYFDTIVLQEEVDGYTLFNPALGIDLILKLDRSVKAVHLYSENHGSGKARMFKDQLPFSLSFSFSREKTRQLLGMPGKTGGGDYSILYGVTPPWDKYSYDSYYLHLQFLPDIKSIDLVTVFSLKE